MESLRAEQRLMLQVVEGAGREAFSGRCRKYASKLSPFGIQYWDELVQLGYVSFSSCGGEYYFLSAGDTLCILRSMCEEHGGSYSAQCIAHQMKELPDAVEDNLKALLREGLVECCRSAGELTWKTSVSKDVWQ